MARPAGPPRRIRAPLGQPTWWSGTSRRPGPTSCGSPTSPMWRPGPALSMWPWSLMRSVGSWSAGRPRGRCAPTWPWTRWRWPSGAARPSWRGWCITPTGASQYLSIRYTERLAEAGAVTSVGSRRRLVRQRPRRDHHRAVQDRADPPARPLERHRRRRIRHLGVGRLVQPPPAPGTHRLCPTSRVRGRLPPKGGPKQLDSSNRASDYEPRRCGDNGARPARITAAVVARRSRRKQGNGFVMRRAEPRMRR